MMRDFNIYSDQEEAFQNLINPVNEELKFYDPIDSIGNWHVNQDYKNVHTQSTHITYNSCASSGGMDDRFDYILMNKYIKDNLNHMAYLNDSYITLGNDGTCFDQALLLCENEGLSNELVNALYYMSDHLPILMQLTTDKSPVVKTIEHINRSIGLYFKNPVKEELSLNLVNKLSGRYDVILMSVYGEIVANKKTDNSLIEIDVNGLPGGIYILYVSDPHGNKASRKIVVLD